MALTIPPGHLSSPEHTFTTMAGVGHLSGSNGLAHTWDERLPSQGHPPGQAKGQPQTQDREATSENQLPGLHSVRVSESSLWGGVHSPPEGPTGP